jgi:hypothetical protein
MKKKEPDLILACANCGEKYIFEDFDMVDEVPMNTTCRKCGFHYLLHSHLKLRASNILRGEPNFEKVSDDGKKFNEYLDKMVGIKNLKK